MGICHTKENIVDNSKEKIRRMRDELPLLNTVKDKIGLLDEIFEYHFPTKEKV
jgi:hypothetical protein